MVSLDKEIKILSTIFILITVFERSHRYIGKEVIKMKKYVIIMMIMIGVIISSTTVYANDNGTDNEVYMPTWMKPNSVIFYDYNLNCKIIEGGQLEYRDIVGRDDIETIGYKDYSTEMIATPNTKVVYDEHGFIQNIYNLVPGTTNEYQLSIVSKARVKSGIMKAGESIEYGEYYNYDTGKKQKCKLRRSADGKKITGTGRITYYTGEYGEAGTHKLVAYDCATKIEKDDVKGGTEVVAENTYAKKTQKYKKNDVGSLPKAILDIWSNSKTNPIKDITTSGKVDNVYSGKITHAAVNY